MTIHVDRLTIRYGDLIAVRDVTAHARPGRITALIGPNAAGKSTLLRAMLGTPRPHQGEVRINGRPSHRLRPGDLARLIAFVPQRPVVSAIFRAREVVELGRYALSVDQRRVADSIERFDLADVADRPFPHLSVGQQQRVTLARAFAQLEPGGCLLLDEPTSAMDLRHVRDVADALRQAAGGGATILLATHDLGLASQLADDAWLMQQGGIAASGEAGDVLTPERLGEVFCTPFSWATDETGRRFLVSPFLSTPS